jgi:Ala-tRNA(Pro) deacylase
MGSLVLGWSAERSVPIESDFAEAGGADGADPLASRRVSDPQAAGLPARIRALLDAEGAPHRFIEHAPTRTSAESAAVRGEPLEIGGKALLLKLGEGEFALFVLSAARALDSEAVRRRFAVRRVRFATPEELLALTGLVPGGVPPFGRPLLPVPLYVDRSVLANERIAFNAGSLTASIVMRVEDWMRIAKPEEALDFSKA